MTEVSIHSHFDSRSGKIQDSVSVRCPRILAMAPKKAVKNSEVVLKKPAVKNSEVVLKKPALKNTKDAMVPSPMDAKVKGSIPFGIPEDQ